MSNQVVDIDSALHIPIDDFRNIAPAFRTAKRGTLPSAPCDQLERPSRNLLAGDSHPDYHTRTPSALATFERLPHQFYVAHAFKREIRTAFGQVYEVRYQVAC